MVTTYEGTRHVITHPFQYAPQAEEEEAEKEDEEAKDEHQK